MCHEFILETTTVQSSGRNLMFRKRLNASSFVVRPVVCTTCVYPDTKVTEHVFLYVFEHR